jgi:hypothetical protein
MELNGNLPQSQEACETENRFFQEIRPNRVIIHVMRKNPHPSIVSRRLLSAFSLWLALCVPSPSAMIEGAREKTWPANPEKHRVTIRREAADDAQTKMIATAEAVRPDAAALREAIGEGPEAKDASQWWYREELGIRIPFALTTEAVDYFTRKVGEYRKQEFKRYLEPSSSIDYHASVALHPQFERDGRKFDNVHVVTLKLVFMQEFAATTTEGMHFEKVRTVVLDEKGKVLAVFGDGPTEAPVFAI